MHHRRLLAAAGAAAAVGLAGPASATVIYDNLPGVDGAVSGSPPASVLTSDSGPLGDSFSTGPAGTLTDVQVLVDAAAPTDGGSFTVGLYTNSATTTPGTLLDSLGTVLDGSLGTTATLVDLPLATPFALAADTRYWIELSGTSGSGRWCYTAANVGIGVANEYNFYAGATSANASFTPYQMLADVNPLASAAPEPAA